MSTYRADRFDHAGLTLLIRRYDRGSIERDERPSDPLVFVLVHGIGVSPRYFHRLAEQLRQHGDVYNVELPGFGSAPRPDHALTIEEFAALLNAFCEARNLTSPVLVGHSMGTQIVTEMAIQNPALSDRVALIGTVVDPQAPTALAQGLRLFRDMMVEPPSANWLVGTDYLRCGPRWYFTQLPVMLDYPIEERLPLVQAAVLILRGARDPVSPAEWSARISELVARPTRLDIPRAAHVVQHRAARTVAGAILEHARATGSDADLQVRGELER